MKNKGTFKSHVCLVNCCQSIWFSVVLALLLIPPIPLVLSCLSLFIMGDNSNIEQVLNELDELVEHSKLNYELQTLDDFINKISGEQEAAPSTSHQPVRWLKRDSDGNVVYDRPRSSRNQTGQFSFFSHIT